MLNYLTVLFLAVLNRLEDIIMRKLLELLLTDQQRMSKRLLHRTWERDLSLRPFGMLNIIVINSSNKNAKIPVHFF